MHSQHTVTPPPLGRGPTSCMVENTEVANFRLRVQKIQINREYFNFIKWEIELEIGIALLIYVSLNDLHFKMSKNLF